MILKWNGGVAMIKEEWKDIKGYEGLYQVSNMGRVKSLDRYRKNGIDENNICFIKGKILSPAKQKDSGYMFVSLSKNRKTKGFRVHRLVAEAFIPNPNKYKCVNHKDENKQNNKVDNLEWCTYKYNLNYGTKIDRYKKTMRLNYGRQINQYDLQGNFIKKWNSVIEAEEYLNKKRASVGICSCCKGRLKKSYGYRWEYADTL